MVDRDPSLLSTFHSLVSTSKGAGFVRTGKEDYKCRDFYYLALKAQYAATVIISTAVLFYKIVKDDETAQLESKHALSLVMEESERCSIFFLPLLFRFPILSCRGSEPEEVFQLMLLLYHQL